MSQPSVVLLDYGSGNLHSAQRALVRVGAQVEVTADPQAAWDAAGLVVPGVGAFAACMAGLRDVGGEVVIRKRVAAGRPVLGICVGMQILFERGVEFDTETAGCGHWPGTVDRLTAPILPHMGWNTVEPPADSILFAGIDPDTRFYFVHSYAARTWDLAEQSRRPRLTWARHHDRFLAAVEDGQLSATQFHPEKSGDAGAHVLRNWVQFL